MRARAVFVEILAAMAEMVPDLGSVCITPAKFPSVNEGAPPNSGAVIGVVR